MAEIRTRRRWRRERQRRWTSGDGDDYAGGGVERLTAVILSAFIRGVVVGLRESGGGAVVVKMKKENEKEKGQTWKTKMKINWNCYSSLVWEE